MWRCLPACAGAAGSPLPLRRPHHEHPPANERAGTGLGEGGESAERSERKAWTRAVSANLLEDAGVAMLPVEVMEKLLPHYQREYRELSDNWIAVERKAQGTCVVAGALLSGALAIIGNSRYTVAPPLYLGFALFAALVFVAAVFAFRALKVSEQTLPPSGDFLRDLAWERMNGGAPDWTDQYQQESLHQQVAHWDTACKDLATSVSRKGSAVASSHAWLLAGAAVALLLITAICLSLWLGIAS